MKNQKQISYDSKLIQQNQQFGLIKKRKSEKADQTDYMSVIKGIARANLKLVELVQTGYIIHGKSVEEQMMNFERIISEHNRKHDKQWLFNDTRLYEIPRPSRYKDLYQRELKRRNDRRTIAFLCKHVMAEKNVKIPMK